MAERLTPGVYVDEVSGGIRPIEGVGTSTVGFIGEAARGIPDRPTFINGFGAYQRAFGGHRRGEAGYLAHAVDAFFAAGGVRAFVTRVLPANATVGVSEAVLARGLDGLGVRREVLRFRAKGEGAWADNIRITIEASRGRNQQEFAIQVNWVEGGRSRPTEPLFDNLRMDPEHEEYVVRVLEERSQYIEAVDLLQAERDLQVRTLPPIPEQAAGLDFASATGTFDVVEGAVLQFRWVDSTGSDDDHEATVAFNNTVAGMTVPDMIRLLSGALGNDYRVVSPAALATLTSADGPFDVSGNQPLTFAVDGNAVAVPMTPATAASINAGPGPFPAIVTGFDLELTINGVLRQATVAAADLAGATPATIASVRNIINNRFGAAPGAPGVVASIDNNDLIIATTLSGADATLEVTGSTAAEFGNPPAASGTDGINNLGVATTEEVAELINAAFADGPYQAFADAVPNATLRIEQTDPGAHTLTVTGTTTPDAVFAVNATANGPGIPGQPLVRVEPAVASRAYLTIRLPDGATEFQAGAAARAVRMTVTRGEGAAETSVTVEANIQANQGRTPAQLAGDLNTAARNDAQDGFGLEAVASGDYLTVFAGPHPAGVRIAIAVLPALVPPEADIWRDEQAIRGGAGALVEDQSSIEISVTEEFVPGLPRISTEMLPTPRSRGRNENSAQVPELRPEESDDTAVRLLNGTDGTGAVSLDQYRGTELPNGRLTGLRAFEDGPIAMLSLPGRNNPAFTSMAMAWCDRNDVFLLVDGPGSLNRDFEISADAVRQYSEGLPARSNNAAMFYPWVQVRDPVGVGQNPTRFMPPSGHIAGVYARTDINRGVWKAGAGIEATVSGAIGLQHEMIDADQDLLNPVGVNCIRQLPGAGIIVWGARTLASDAEWRYVPVRRMALFLKRSLRRGLQWAVFEPNDQDLWDLMRINVTNFMLGLFQQGAFQGATPAEAFLVKCDRETNPQVLIDQGIVTIRVGFAPLKPAEFVVVELQQLQQVSEGG